MKRIMAGFVFFTITFSGFFLWATVVLKMDVSELTKRSSTIVIGEVVEIEKEFEDVPHADGAQILNTTLDVKVTQILKEHPRIKEGDMVSVHRVGGRVGELDMRVPGAPTFKSKTKVLLFLSEIPDTGALQITGFSQGKFRIMEDAQTGEEIAIQDKQARTLTLVDEKTGEESEKPISDRMNLKELKDEIRESL